jgi:hypothetical protein
MSNKQIVNCCLFATGFAYPSTLKMKAVRFSETSINLYQITWQKIITLGQKCILTSYKSEFIFYRYEQKFISLYADDTKFHRILFSRPEMKYGDA